MPEQNYRGVKPAHIVVVLEGNGTKEHPWKEEQYVIAYENYGGISRLTTIGKIIPLTEEEKTNF